MSYIIMELEFKKIVGYLPYGVNCQATTKQKSMFKLSSLRTSDDLKYYKPILHPLSDLTKEIEIGGEKFVPIDELECLFDVGPETGINGYGVPYLTFYYADGDDSIGINEMIGIIQKLYEWHFDIHGLIDEGLAIDINTL